MELGLHMNPSLSWWLTVAELEVQPLTYEHSWEIFIFQHSQGSLFQDLACSHASTVLFLLFSYQSSKEWFFNKSHVHEVLIPRSASGNTTSKNIFISTFLLEKYILSLSQISLHKSWWIHTHTHILIFPNWKMKTVFHCFIFLYLINVRLNIISTFLLPYVVKL